MSRIGDWRCGIRVVTAASALSALLLYAWPAHAAEPSTTIRWDPQSLRQVYDPKEGFYSYAPSVIEEAGVEHLWACHNEQPNVIRDHIRYFQRVGDVLTPGPLIPGPLVLGPGPSAAWDCFHVCDPVVVKGEFSFAGAMFRYAMFYLGNDVDASRNNQIGIAFSNEFTGPWKRFDRPIVAYPRRGGWGVGQASVTSIDGKGRLLLFYTKEEHGCGGFRRELDLSDMSKPCAGPEAPITNRGLPRSDGRPDDLSNFDVVYDPARDRFFAVREQWPHPSSHPTFISDRLQIVSIAAKSIWQGGGSWRVEGSITPELTRLDRNHNAGIVRTVYGTLPSPNRLRVLFASSDVEPDPPAHRSLWTYALHEIAGDIVDQPEPQPK